MMQRKGLVLLGISIFLVVAGVWYGLDKALPSSIHRSALYAIQSAGFTEASLPSPKVGFGRIQYKDIKLDAEAFSTIGTLDIRYNPIAVLFMRKVSSVDIDSLSLTGEMKDDNTLSIAGWVSPTVWPSFLWSIGKIHIQKSHISLLTDVFGGLTFDWEGQARQDGTHTEFQGNIESRQKSFAVLATVTGILSHAGLWEADLNIEHGRIERPAVKLTRLSGGINVSGDEGQKAKVFSEFRAGGATLYNTPWNNLSGTLEGNAKGVRILANAKSTGITGVELDLDAQYLQDSIKVKGALHSDSFENLDAVLQTAEVDVLPSRLRNAQDMTLRFFMDDQTQAYYIINQGERSDETGQVSLERFRGGF